MTRHAHAARIVAELGESMGMSGLSLDEGGAVSLAFDELPVTIAYAAEPVELLWLMADLGAVPDGVDGKDALKGLLQVGLASWATNRMTVGLDESGRRAVGFTAIPITHLNAELLQEVLGALIDIAQPVRAQLAAGQLAPERPDEPGGAPGGMLRV